MMAEASSTAKPAPKTYRLAGAVFAWMRWRSSRPAPALDQLSENMLRDIGMPEDRRSTMLAYREAKHARLRARAIGELFFVAPR